MEMATEMQTAASSHSLQRGHTTSYNQSKRSASQNERVPAQASSGRASSSTQDTIARSMSRYRGHRPALPPVSIPVPPIDFSTSQRPLPPRNSSLKDPHSPRNVEEDSARNKDLRPRAQSLRKYPPLEKTPDTRVNENGNAHLSKRRPTLSEKQLKSPVLESSDKGEDPDRDIAIDASQIRTERRQSLAHDGYRHKSNIRGTRHEHTGRENGYMERLDGGAQQYGNPRNPQNTVHERQKKPMVSKGPALAASRQVPPKKSFTDRMADRIRSSHRNDAKADLKKMISTPIAIGSGGEVSAPQFDAPISAVNAGERRVIVKSKDLIISLPVTPSTTPVDIIRSIASHEPGSIDVGSSVLLESFKQVGLERPIRRYEHIRDILNSWDADTQNTLFIEPSPNGGDDNLDVRSLSQVQPKETSLYLYYSQRPGHWDKRFITLRSDGQVVGKKSGSENFNICHLSDFDIYVPTPRQVARHVKPPKKICFAVKSQQKSSMFISTTNFIHFFSTGDKELAKTWYKAVQEWRSWYLFNVMGKGQRSQSPVKNGVTERTKSFSGSHRGREKSSYRPAHGLEIGGQQGDPIAPRSSQRQMQPKSQIPRVSSVDRPGTSRGPTEVNGPSSSTKPARSRAASRAAPPISFPKNFAGDTIPSSPTIPSTPRARGASIKADSSDQEPFTNTGLLGRTYSLRQKSLAQNERPSTAKQGYIPPIPSAPGITNVDSTGTGLNRISSQRHKKPKPLIDLTPVYQEPPQHMRKGKGFIPDQIPAGGLVDIATSPEIAIPIPPVKAWRRQINGVGDQG